MIELCDHYHNINFSLLYEHVFHVQGMFLFVLSQGCSEVSGFVQAMLSLLLPVGCEYNPSLVLLVRMLDSEVCDSVWQQLTSLLQGLAQGHTLVLMQVRMLGCSQLSIKHWMKGGGLKEERETQGQGERVVGLGLKVFNPTSSPGDLQGEGTQILPGKNLKLVNALIHVNI